jgi:hypothetical protein
LYQSPLESCTTNVRSRESLREMRRCLYAVTNSGSVFPRDGFRRAADANRTFGVAGRRPMRSGVTGDVVTDFLQGDSQEAALALCLTMSPSGATTVGDRKSRRRTWIHHASSPFTLLYTHSRMFFTTIRSTRTPHVSSSKLAQMQRISMFFVS